MAPKVEQVVMATDKATLALAKKAITLEAVPPGQQATRINPTAKKGGNWNKIPNPQPNNGITVNCKNIPKTTHEGVLATKAKSFQDKVSPIPNMIPPRP